MKWFCKYWILKHEFDELKKKYYELFDMLDKEFWERFESE